MIGDQNDIRQRIKAQLPNGWFRNDTPILDAILSGLAWGLSLVYDLIQYTKRQTRISTASDGFLDLIAYDFFGTKLPRRSQENDDPYRARILATLLREKGTRQGMIKAIIALTGRTPIVFEPARPADTGGWSLPFTGWSLPVGGWGSLLYRAQVFITAYRPTGSGIPNVIGWGGTAGGWSRPGQIRWSNLREVQGFVTDKDIFALIDEMKPAGVTAWVRIQS